MKALILLVLVAIAVGIFMIASNTQKASTPEQEPWEWVCSQSASGCNN